MDAHRKTPLTVAAVLSVALTGCGAATAATSGASDGANSGGGAGGTINLVAYSTPQAAYKQLETAFQHTSAGRGVTFTESFGASGDQSRAVASGQPADFVAFSLTPDMDRLVKAGLVATGYNSGTYKGIVTDSVVVFVVRKGNPKGINSWTDLIKPGVDVISPNPFQSGGARWNTIAGYGALRAAGKSDADSVQYLKTLYTHVSVQDNSARTALQTFTSGKGDVLLDYESDAIYAQKHGQDIDYVVPDQTILIETPVAVTADAQNPTAAKAFLDWLFTPAAQKLWADNGYRPVVSRVQGSISFKPPPQLFTIASLGGWTQVNTRFFDPTTGVMAGIEKSIGVSVGG